MPSLKLKAIQPTHMPSGEEYLKAMHKAVQKSAALTLRDLEATVKTWSAKSKPVFDVTITQSGDEYSVAAGTDDNIYGWVDGGTKRHIIRPRRSRYLRFRSGYVPKTRIGVINSYPGGAFGANVFTNRAVNHPGFKGRGFTKAIARRRQTTTIQEISQAIALVARQAK